ncbi:MAG: ABC transporter transmembrane domain-containing protein [Paracoccaceae bacterium]|nr:ABC transporter transmembrane domain-containing protein [Paracoccaceae bacterium]
MERSFSRYIWKHTSREQIWILCLVGLSMIPYYLAFDLPKRIVNGPIQGTGFEAPGAVQTFMPISVDLPYFGVVNLFGGMELERLPTLVGLSLAFLALVIVNGVFKYYINTFKGLLGERLLRRIRFELVDRILRFHPRHFKHVKAGEISSMVKDEVEPLGGFTGDAFVQPAMLGGQALTAMVFIFVQNFWLGLVACGMAAVQIGVIPPLRQRLIVLGRQRQVGARQLAGRVSEIVDGINTIHTYDTSNYERADISNRLGAIFNIRYEIYQRKFMVKFLNNFLAQVTPFLFYMIGGFLTIRGTLDVGQLVAVINAYKELPGPLKELIDWDLTRQDVQVKYEQVVQQFDGDNMIDPELQAVNASSVGRLGNSLSVTNLTLQDDSGAKTLDHVTMKVTPGETIAIVGDANSGADAMAEALARIVFPASGRVSAGNDDIHNLPESVTGRRISYASSDTYFFYGTLKDNLLYGLKNAPREKVKYSGDAAVSRKWARSEARKTGNPDFDLNSNWIDHTSANGVSEEDGLLGSLMAVLDVVQMTDDVFEFALHSTPDVQADPDLAKSIVGLRKHFRQELDRRGLNNIVVPFEVGSYNTEARVGENLLFGVLRNTSDNIRTVTGTEYFQRTVVESGLGEQLLTMGLEIAENTLELFQDLPRDHPFFERLSYMEADDIPAYQTLVARVKGLNFMEVDFDDCVSLISLSFMYVEPHHRFGVLNEDLMRKITEVRDMFHASLPPSLLALIECYDPENYLESGNLLDNIVFGKINYRINDAEKTVRGIITDLVLAEPGLYKRILAVGLDYNLGASGRKLTVVQRQKLNFARALIRRSDYYIFNRPMSGLDSGLQQEIISATLRFLSSQADNPAVVWVLATKAFTKHFQRVVVFGGRTVLEDETRAVDKEKLEMNNNAVLS